MQTAEHLLVHITVGISYVLCVGYYYPLLASGCATSIPKGLIAYSQRISLTVIPLLPACLADKERADQLLIDYCRRR